MVCESVCASLCNLKAINHIYTGITAQTFMLGEERACKQELCGVSLCVICDLHTTLHGDDGSRFHFHFSLWKN